MFKSYVLGRYSVFMTGREAAKILLTGKPGLVSLNLFYTGKQVLGSTSLLTQSGESHKRLRRLIQEPLSMDSMKKYFPFINSMAMETLDSWSGRKILFLEEASTVEFFVKPEFAFSNKRGEISLKQFLCFTVHFKGDWPHDNELGTEG